MVFRFTEDARSLQLAVTKTDFISSLAITNSCLKYINALIIKLQTEAKDIVAVREILNVKAAINNARSNIEEHHSLLRYWF